MRFEQDKKAKLSRLPVLRVMNALGMIAWRDDTYDAKQYLRLIHPLSWVYLMLQTLYAFFSIGVPQGLQEIAQAIKEETVLY